MVIIKKIYYFLLIFLILLVLLLIDYSIKYHSIIIIKNYDIKNVNKIKQLKPNNNIIEVENRIYYNKSFGLNYLDMCQKKDLMKFNRKIPNFNSNVLITLILIYPNPFSILESKITDYIDVISKEIDFNFSLAIITCNNDISNLMINNSFQNNLKYISKFNLNNIGIPNSEYYSFCYPFKK